MEVTRKNFNEALPLVGASIKKADFLVIDAEFTGLINGRDVSIFDSPQEYYATLYNGSTEFLLIQYGLCAFYWDEKERKYMNDAYNFYLFPGSQRGLEKMFLCQSSSLDFLATQGFDFNKLFREGISYMTEPLETRLRESLLEKQKLYSNDKGTVLIPDENKQQIEDICEKVRMFLKESQDTEMEIDRCNAFIRRLLFQELGIRFKDEVILETKVLENKNRVLKVTRLVAGDDKKCHDTKRKEKEWEEFDQAIGFSKIARMISQSEKLVIGHNMLLDLIHTLNHFFQPLPADYDSFKEFAHCMFPRILDTKYMSSLPPFKDKMNSSVLQHLLFTLSEPPFSLPEIESLEGRGYRRTDDKQHEAGYDAYVTGLCFLAMHAHLTRMRGEEQTRVTQDSALLKPFVNKVFLSKTAHQDSPYINLAGVDPTPSREHVFHLTFPKEWQRNDINHLFSAYGQITVQFLDETSALVALSRRELARTVSKAFVNHKRITLLPFMKYKYISKVQKQFQMDAKPNDALPEETSQKDNEKLNKLRAMQPTKGLESPDLSKISRTRSNSLSSLPKQTSRKRSGEFLVEEAEPPPKKSENTPNTKPERTNGRRKASESEKEIKDKRKENTGNDLLKDRKKEKVVVEFDSGTKGQCVKAFEESDCWD
ncbi:poly(A)-specific ribonuclease PARN-like isoform X2 [Leptidea sinapis]|uniref:poly(A)-specific ribonuclease PARN-like isoform X2 n=1 Tax=Leptidea sinapis TaxID=189913 RepID=UPI002140B5E4|nr:poly(A)-specific ribonuclease PARN-like isoform X2 [Leptidea sinapis]